MHLLDGKGGSGNRCMQGSDDIPQYAAPVTLKTFFQFAAYILAKERDDSSIPYINVSVRSQRKGGPLRASYLGQMHV